MLDAFKIGYYTDEKNKTGATVIIAKDGAVGGVSVRGSAPATRETDLLRPTRTVQKVNAVVLSGGSAFGLEASDGVAEYLFEQGCGYNAGAYRVPIVVGASVYDLEYGSFAYPNKNNGKQAAESAKVGDFRCGNVGGGCGATVSKLAGINCAVKGGLGYATYKLNNLEIAVIVVVNALGDIVKDGNIILGAKGEDGNFLDSRRVLSLGGMPTCKGGNTTIGVVLTNANLNKEQTNLLADCAHDGFALSISPSHTMYDGDAMFCLASGETEVAMPILMSIVPELTARAIWSIAEKPRCQTKTVNRMLFRAINHFLKPTK